MISGFVAAARALITASSVYDRDAPIYLFERKGINQTFYFLTEDLNKHKLNQLAVSRYDH